MDSLGSKARQQEILNAIDAFDQILDVMPEDIPSLKAVFNAYEELQDRMMACSFVERLGTALLDEGDVVGLEALIPRAEAYIAEGGDAVANLVAQMKQAVQDGVSAESAVDSGTDGERPVRSDDVPPAGNAVSHRFDIEPELALAWGLLEAGDLTQDEYSSVVQDLTEMSVGESAETVSVLHVLEARGFKRLESIIGRIAQECNAPTVSLACFDIQTDEYLLPMDFMLRRGALIFEHVGEHVLVAVLNPYDEQLRKDVQAIVSRKCHFFTTLPSEFDEALNRISDVHAQSGAALPVE